MLATTIATSSLFAIRLLSFGEMSDRLNEGDPVAWAQLFALVAVVCILFGYGWSRK